MPVNSLEQGRRGSLRRLRITVLSKKCAWVNLFNKLINSTYNLPIFY